MGGYLALSGAGAMVGLGDFEYLASLGRQGAIIGCCTMALGLAGAIATSRKLKCLLMLLVVCNVGLVAALIMHAIAAGTKLSQQQEAMEQLSTEQWMTLGAKIGVYGSTPGLLYASVEEGFYLQQLLSLSFLPLTVLLEIALTCFVNRVSALEAFVSTSGILQGCQRI